MTTEYVLGHVFSTDFNHILSSLSWTLTGLQSIKKF